MFQLNVQVATELAQGAGIGTKCRTGACCSSISSQADSRPSRRLQQLTRALRTSARAHRVERELAQRAHRVFRVVDVDVRLAAELAPPEWHVEVARREARAALRQLAVDRRRLVVGVEEGGVQREVLQRAAAAVLRDGGDRGVEVGEHLRAALRGRVGGLGGGDVDGERHRAGPEVQEAPDHGQPARCDVARSANCDNPGCRALELCIVLSTRP
jgi:hypothetical protein